ncbi:hypothetical protein C499_15015 [Halogeometricum borinquense DSM 11551]|uniref:Uncharacterized protein n=1 Tax=Halogeometricum borinquense (strain ATCC 700274 / DSM 11551 / JCM 10706 / KCTC 4070 / PR3) TaxID=469382 RepID=E4NTT2_HALBP|nr:hypothetical protein [Halogeometricum borinquense]ADQ68237.1 hypothetical protein Hbor_26890 [Halogeometricum borinquense DSM 11551]ELY24719.1 hypothetical protein C499_15015 [Halogeometricum borinquense DSM 11551]
MLPEPVATTVSDEVPGRPPQRGLAHALHVPRNVKIGAIVGIGLAVVAYAFRVLELFGPFVGTREYPVLGPEGWFAVLAFVLASSTALLVASLLTLVSAYRLVKDM